MEQRAVVDLGQDGKVTTVTAPSQDERFQRWPQFAGDGRRSVHVGPDRLRCIARWRWIPRRAGDEIGIGHSLRRRSSLLCREPICGPSPMKQRCRWTESAGAWLRRAGGRAGCRPVFGERIGHGRLLDAASHPAPSPAAVDGPRRQRSEATWRTRRIRRFRFVAGRPANRRGAGRCPDVTVIDADSGSPFPPAFNSGGVSHRHRSNLVRPPLRAHISFEPEGRPGVATGGAGWQQDTGEAAVSPADGRALPGCWNRAGVSVGLRRRDRRQRYRPGRIPHSRATFAAASMEYAFQRIVGATVTRRPLDCLRHGPIRTP